MNPFLSAYKDLIESELEKIDFSNRPKELYDPISYFLALGGKRIRPILCMMSAELFGSNKVDVMKAAIGIEVFHNFTLIHDDIMDNAPVRRGQPTVHEKWNRDIAILSGDVMFVKAFDLICEQKTSQLNEVLRIFNRTAIEVCEGQQLDMNFELEQDVSIDEYIEMICLKTSVLLACSLKIGALLAGAEEQEADKIYEFGKNLGIAFQIQDDYLDAYADPDQFGKTVGGDILANKKTYLMLTAKQDADPDQLYRLNELVNSDGDDKVEATKRLFNEIKVPEKTQQAIDQYFDKAMQNLYEIEAIGSKKAFLELAAYLMNRKI